jgi:hypothetical protein
MRTSPEPTDTVVTFQAQTEADMTARAGSAEWHRSVEGRPGTITVGGGGVVGGVREW